jgi:DNA-binding LytR/AlgR family response regulator
LKILIVEDDVFVQEDLKEVLESLGHEVIHICESYEEVIGCLNEGEVPDIAFIDIQLKSSFDGVDVAEYMREKFKTKLIFLTSITDDRILHKAAVLKIDGYLVKPFKSQDIKVAISMLVDNSKVQNKEYLFLKDGHEQFKILMKDILYAEAEDNYVYLYFNNSRKLLSMSLKTLEKELLEPRFLRIHRSYLINMDNVERVGANYVTIDKKQIPMNDSSKVILKRHLNL